MSALRWSRRPSLLRRGPSRFVARPVGAAGRDLRVPALAAALGLAAVGGLVWAGWEDPKIEPAAASAGPIGSTLRVTIGDGGSPAGASLPSPAGSRTDDALDVCLVIDDSGSTGGNDSRTLRYAQARRAVDFLAAQGSNGVVDRVCVVHFGTFAAAQLPLTPVEDRRDIDTVLEPLSLGHSVVASGVTAGSRLLGPEQPNRRRVMVVVTDGQSADTAAELKAALGPLPPDRAHVVALLPEGRVDRFDRARWEQMGVRSIRAAGPSGDGVASALARIFVDELGLRWGAL